MLQCPCVFVSHLVPTQQSQVLAVAWWMPGVPLSPERILSRSIVPRPVCQLICFKCCRIVSETCRMWESHVLVACLASVTEPAAHTPLASKKPQGQS